MVNRNCNFDINKLVLIGALVTLISDFIDLLISYQVYCNRSNRQDTDIDIGIEESIGRGRF
ncbi:MAG: hypothetical protein GX625_13185 [Clostridiaceae bacterium]|jgi:hypothetical protein|nr:hypothetical protein [Clostridiaceae bacterium]